VNVLLVAYKSDVTGGERVLLQLAAALMRSGHCVHGLSPSPGPLDEELTALGASVYHLPMRRTFDVPVARRMADLIERRAIHLVHTHGMLVNVLGRMACRFAGGVPCVSTVHLTRDLGGPPRVGGWLAGLKNRWYYRPLDNWTARWNARVIAVSEAVRDDLIRQGYAAETIEVIPNGVNPAPFDAVTDEQRVRARREAGAGDGDVLLGVVARLSPQKDVATFVEAFALLEHTVERPSIRAFVAGTGPLEADLRRLVADRDLESRLRFLGHRNDIPALLRASDVFVLPSRWEGLPLTVLEAMACRCPVVATAVDGTREAVVDGETGILVPPGDRQALAATLGDIVADPDRRTAMGAAGRARLDRHFHVDRVVEHHLQLYERVLAGKRPR